MICKKHLNGLTNGKCLLFSGKLNKPSHPKIVFNNAQVVYANWQKRLEMYLNKALNFNLHIKEKISKEMKRIGVIQKLTKTLLRHSLITIYISFVRPHLDYGDIIYDQPKEFNTMLPLQLQVRKSAAIFKWLK